jgi:hypothetical protein
MVMIVLQPGIVLSVNSEPSFEGTKMKESNGPLSPFKYLKRKE